MTIDSLSSQRRIIYGSFDATSECQHPCIHENSIALFMDRRLVQEIPVEESRLHFVSRKVMGVVGVVGGFAGRAPFVQMNLDLGGENLLYGGALALGTSLSFGCLVSYAFLNIINSQMHPLSKEEQALTEARVSSTLKKTFFLGSTLLGFGAQIPFAYIAYQYNPPSTLNPKGLTMPIVVLTLDSSITAYSAYRGLEIMSRHSCIQDEELKLFHLRKKMCRLIEKNIALLGSAGPETRGSVLNAYDTIKNISILERMDIRVAACYALFTQPIAQQNSQAVTSDRYMDYLVQAYGYICSACNIGTLGYVAWRGTDALLGNIYANVGFTGLYVATSLYLNVTAIPQGASSLFRSFRNLVTCRYQPTLPFQLTPKLAFLSHALVVTTVALSYGPAVKLSQDYYSSDERVNLCMEIILSCGTVFLVAMPMLSIMNQVLEYKLEHWGNQEEKTLIALYKKMRHFLQVLSCSPLIQVASFLKLLPSEMVETLLQEAEMTFEHLNEYIDRHAPLMSREEMSRYVDI